MAMLPNYKDIIELLKKGSTLEAQEKILDLRSAAMDLQKENLALSEQIKLLESKLQLRGRVEWEKPYYWLLDGEKRDGPYCQLCYDKSSDLIRLQGRHTGTWLCFSCGKTFHDKNYRSPRLNRHR